MKLTDGRRFLSEMRARYTDQPYTAFSAHIETAEPTIPVLADTLVALAELPAPVPRRAIGPATVCHPSDRTRTWSCSVEDIAFWRNAGMDVLDPRDDAPATTLPQRKNGSAA